MANVADQVFDFLHSSHCLEYLSDPEKARENRIRGVRPRGHPVIQVPDEDRYEQIVRPSGFNPDHKHRLTMFKPSSWSPGLVNVLDLLRSVAGLVEMLSVLVVDQGLRYGILGRGFDQTRTPSAEAGIEFVLRRR